MENDSTIVSVVAVRSLAIFAISCCGYGATAYDLLGRYGLATMQRFTTQGVAISVEYNNDHHVTGVRITPMDESKTNKSVMDQQVVSALIDSLLPATSLRRSVDELDCPIRGWDVATGIMSRTCGITKTENGVTLYRQRVDHGEERHDLLVTIATSPGLPLTPIAIESRFGPPVSEQFLAAPSIKVTATYDDKRTAKEIQIEPADQTQKIVAAEGDQIVRDLVPPWTRLGTPRSGIMFMGCNELRVEEWENVTITRSYHHCNMPAEDQMVQATIRWVSRSTLSNSTQQ